MLSAFNAIFVSAVTFCTFKVAQGDCPCTISTIVTCADPSLSSIPDCVNSDVIFLEIKTSSVPLAAETIRRFKKLEGLEISHIDYPQFSKDFLSGHADISLLGISHTSLDYFNRKWIKYTPRIKTLYLDHNKLDSLPMDSFSSLPLLEVLHLNDNQLTTISPTLLQGTAIKELNIDNNPWHCACVLAMFVKWAKDHGVELSDQGICSEPQQLRGRKVNSLTRDLVC